MRDFVFFFGSIQKSSGKLLGSMTFESNSATFLKVSDAVVFFLSLRMIGGMNGFRYWSDLERERPSRGSRSVAADGVDVVV